MKWVKDQCFHYVETSRLFYCGYQVAGFYVMEAFVFYGLTSSLCLQHATQKFRIQPFMWSFEWKRFKCANVWEGWLTAVKHLHIWIQEIECRISSTFESGLNLNLGGGREGVILPPVGFPLITKKRYKSCNPGILQHSVTFY